MRFCPPPQKECCRFLVNFSNDHLEILNPFLKLKVSRCSQNFRRSVEQYPKYWTGKLRNRVILLIKSVLFSHWSIMGIHWPMREVNNQIGQRLRCGIIRLAIRIFWLVSRTTTHFEIKKIWGKKVRNIKIEVLNLLMIPMLSSASSMSAFLRFFPDLRFSSIS